MEPRLTIWDKVWILSMTTYLILRYGPDEALRKANEYRVREERKFEWAKKIAGIE